MWFFATLLEALKGFLFATSSTILYPGAAMSKRPVLLNQILLIIIILLASCDGTIRSKSDVEELCQAGEYEQLYEWITKTISSSSVIEVQTQEPQLEDAIACLINHYRSLDPTQDDVRSIQWWLSNIESFHFSRPDIRKLGLLPRIFLSSQFRFQDFDKLFIYYFENESITISSMIDSMLQQYQPDQYRSAYENFVSKRLTTQNQYVTLKSILTKISTYVSPMEGAWCDSVMESLNIEIARAKKIDEENIQRAKVLDEQLHKAENELAALQEDFERLKSFDEEINSLEKKVQSLKHEVDQAKYENGMSWISGSIIGLSSQSSYSHIYECSDNQGNHFLLETFYTSFNSQGSFSLYAKKQPDVAITTVNGFKQNWAKWAEVSEEGYSDYMLGQGALRVALKKELTDAKQLLDQSQNKKPVNIDKTIKNLKRQLTEKSLSVLKQKEALSSLPITINPTLRNSVTDIDGNVYETAAIGNQVWMAENLKVTHYRDGTEITPVTDITAWTKLSTEAYCYYDNNSSNGDTYGALYNWYAVSDSRNIAPAGWHVPTDEEWQTLVDYLGGSGVAGGKMKETGKTHWDYPNTGATNESGFSALPGGYRNLANGHYYNVGSSGYFWSAPEYTRTDGWDRLLTYNHSDVYRHITNKKEGLSVRLVRD